MNRRKFLQAAAVAASAGSVSTRLLAAPAAGASRFLLVFLRGGYDAANLLVPVSSNFYYESRPNIAVAREAALAIDADWGLHPALRDTIHPLFRKGQAAFVPFAGTEDLTRSHFETQDSIELGQGKERARGYQSGFLNRLAAALDAPRPISFTDQMPVAFRGEAQVANVAIRSLARPGLDARQSALIAQMYQGGALGTPVAEGFAVRDGVMRDLAGEMEASGRNAASARGFELESRRIARLM
jgi:uncharacterized protein (DUF1501 family)